MKKPKFIKDAIVWNRWVGENGAWLRASNLNLVRTDNDEYYIKKMDDLEKLYISIENGTFKNSNVPTIVKKNKLVEVLNKIKKFFEKLTKSNNSDLQENK